MARKNLLASVTGPDLPKADHDMRSGYGRRGASRSMMISIDEMAENAKKMIAGETIVSLDTSVIDSSFISDRLEEHDEDYIRLREAIKDQGQMTPILVRPHPKAEGRYMIVFGHRRTRIAKDLGLPVRAIVKTLEDIAHIIAQGQENSARANLSFIEKARLGQKLLDMGQSKDTIKSALMVDDTLLSRMLSVTEIIPAAVIEAIGAAKTVGRDRWEDLKKQMIHPAGFDIAMSIMQSDDFRATDGADRFNHLLAGLKSKQRKSRPLPRQKTQSSSWAADNIRIAAEIRTNGKVFRLSLTEKDAFAFGKYMFSKLPSLYEIFRAAQACGHGEVE